MDKSKYKILLVDDEKNILESLRRNFKIEGYNVDISSSSVDALEKIKNEKYHIVMTDIVMPDMDGIELLKKIKEYDSLTQVIMMTGYSTMDKTIQSLENGANDYILKPFKSIDNVLEIIGLSIEKLERWRNSIRDNMK